MTGIIKRDSLEEPADAPTLAEDTLGRSSQQQRREGRRGHQIDTTASED